MAVLEDLKAFKPDLTVIIYGSHPTFQPEQSMSPSAVDFALLGYPERTLVELLHALRAGESLEEVGALCYRDGGRVWINRRLSRGAFSSLPIIEYDFLDRRLRYRNPLVQQYPYVTAVTSRGCSGSCVFCTAPAFAGHRVEVWPAERVVEQIQSITDQGYREVFFRDETFSAFRSRNREVYNGLLRRGIEVGWICNVKPGTVTLEDLKLMKRAGCRLVKVGVESGSSQVLMQSGKGISVDTTRRLMANIHRVGLASHAHVMLGMPGDTPDSIEETMSFVLDLEPTSVDVGICTPLPGSRLWTQGCAEQRDGLALESLEAAKLHTRSVLNDSYCEVRGAELERGQRLMYRRFYLRPRYILRRAAEVRSFGGWWNLARSGVAVTGFALRSLFSSHRPRSSPFSNP
jgi:radical SAM superfamily enzyme YgiQ (UPF0313 family)